MPRKSFGRVRSSLIVVLAVFAAAFAVAAVATAASSSSTPAWLKPVDAYVQQGYKGIDMQVPATGPKAAKHKLVWNIVCSLNIPDCASVNTGVNQAGKALGWTVNTVDNESDPVTAGTQIMDAVAAKANGIVVTGIDCDAVKSALQAAVNAGIKTVAAGGQNCSKPLYDAISPIGDLPFDTGEEYVFTKGRIDWAMASHKGNLKFIVLNVTDLAAVYLETDQMERDIKVCPTCKIIDTIDVTAASSFSGLGQDVAAALTKYPQANALWIFNGSAFDFGVKTDLVNAGRATGKNRMLIVSGTCSYGEPALIRAGWDIGCDAFSLTWNGWAAMDQLNRLFAGEKPSQIPEVGVGLQIVDATHNLPKGSAWVPPINYVADYKKLWATGKS